MKVLFLTIGRLENLEDFGIYSDLLRCFIRNGHDVYALTPYEKRLNKATELVEHNNAHILHIRIGNITKCGTIEKGISTLLIERYFISAIKRYFADVKFDLILYSTPPITFAKVIQYVKKRDNAKTYLLLKDIFPQNAVDLGMMNKSGIKGLIYKYFRNKEKNLYRISDTIGCMSQANVNYILKHNPDLHKDTVEVCPNSIEYHDISIDNDTKIAIRKKYTIPLDKKVFVYGGNLGKPQGIPFLIDCLKSQAENSDVFFLIVGDGTEYSKLENFYNQAKPVNVCLMKRIPKEDYDKLVAACDVGLIFLDYRFTIPNFPSRILSYMQAQIPVIACTDPYTDIGKVIVDNGFGWSCRSNNVKEFDVVVRQAINSDHSNMKNNELKFLSENYTVDNCYEIIISSMGGYNE